MTDRDTKYQTHDPSERDARLHRSVAYDAPLGARTRDNPRETTEGQETAVHPMVGEIAIGAAVWFIVVMWFAFARGPEVDYILIIVTLFFVMFFTLFLLTASYGWEDPRWHLPHTTFAQFLQSRIRTATGTMRGRDVLIEIATVPVSLAIAATLIGLVWSILH
jgi:hypothetical protein